jgi:transposase-like protein
MNLTCPSCNSECVKKNGHIHNGKQNHRCLVCGRQFVEKREQKLITEERKELIQQALLERVSLSGICRIFKVSLPWLLEFMEAIFRKLPDHLNVTYIAENEELEVAILEMDEQHGYVGNKKNDQWLWLAFHSKTRQVIAFHVGKRTKASGLALLDKVPEDLKKKPSFTQINSMFITKLFPGLSIDPLEKSLAKQVILKDLIVLLDRGSQDL